MMSCRKESVGDLDIPCLGIRQVLLHPARGWPWAGADRNQDLWAKSSIRNWGLICRRYRLREAKYSTGVPVSRFGEAESCFVFIDRKGVRAGSHGKIKETDFRRSQKKFMMVRQKNFMRYLVLVYSLLANLAGVPHSNAHGVSSCCRVAWSTTLVHRAVMEWFCLQWALSSKTSDSDSSRSLQILQAKIWHRPFYDPTPTNTKYPKLIKIVY